MRSSIAIFFIVLMVSTSSKEFLHFVLFKFNQENITSLLCINKDKPELKCDGKCYLKKSIETAAKKEESKPVSSPDEKSPVILTQITLVSNRVNSVFKSFTDFAYLAPVSAHVYGDIPHPPEV